MSFSSDFAKFAKLTNSSLDETGRAIALELFGSIIRDTPVDTGRAKGNWFVTEGTPSTAISSDIDMAATGSVSGKSLQELGNVTIKLGFDFLTNNLPYIGSLEFGRSNQAPLGMVRTTLRQFSAIAKKEGGS